MNFSSFFSDISSVSLSTGSSAGWMAEVEAGASAVATTRRACLSAQYSTLCMGDVVDEVREDKATELLFISFIDGNEHYVGPCTRSEAGAILEVYSRRPDYQGFKFLPR